MSLPVRIEVMFASAVLSAALCFSTIQIKQVILRTRTEDHTLRVPGAAKRRVESDLAVFRATATYQASDSARGYQGLAAAVTRLQAALRERRGTAGQSDNLQLSAITVSEICQSEHCRTSGQLDRYELSQRIEIRSADLEGLARLSSDTAALVQAAALATPEIKLTVNEPEFIFTHLEELKLAVLADATRSAHERAAQLAGAASVQLGGVLSANLGDVEIRLPDQPGARYADDAASRKKDIVANVTVTYAIR